MITKICGIKTRETILCCENNNVDYFGLIFYPGSPRYISFDLAKELINYSDNLKINAVGVFVNEELDKIKNLVQNLKLKYVQLHGDETNEYIKILKKNKIKIIKKISIESKSDLQKIENYTETDFFLFDYKPKVGELPGGNSKKFDWQIVQNLKIEKPWLLSGGINLNNIMLIKTKINPYGVDLSSGVEKELGIKDNRIINNFIGKLKNA